MVKIHIITIFTVVIYRVMKYEEIVLPALKGKFTAGGTPFDPITHE